MTEGDSLTGKIAAVPANDEDNSRDNVVTPSEWTTRTFVVDATEQLEAHRGTISSNLIPGVADVTQGVQGVGKSVKECVRMFRIDNEIFDVNREQLDRVRMSKCESGRVGK
jgi:hypothetical protein